MALKEEKRYNRFVSIQEALLNFLMPELKKRGIDAVAIFEMWREILGSELAENLFLVKISTARNGKRTIHLLTSTDAYSLELSYKKDTIIKRLNTTLGLGYISDMKVMVSSISDIMKKAFKIPKIYVTKNLDLSDKKEFNKEECTDDDERLKNVLHRLKLFYVDGVVNDENN